MYSKSRPIVALARRVGNATLKWIAAAPSFGKRRTSLCCECVLLIRHPREITRPQTRRSCSSSESLCKENRRRQGSFYCKGIGGIRLRRSFASFVQTDKEWLEGDIDDEEWHEGESAPRDEKRPVAHEVTSCLY